MIEHCLNYDQEYEGCRECPGKVVLIRRDGSVDTICRAGQQKVKALIATADNGLPIFPIPYPVPDDAA